MPKRINELDFLKCVLIILMVMFHLVSFGDKYPELKRFVYTFHMPGFLLLSGYLTNRLKESGKFLRSIRSLFVPYLIMEAGYIFMASILPIREHIDSLTIGSFSDKLFLHPIGPYWFIHTLIICEVIYYLTFKIINKNWSSHTVVNTYNENPDSSEKINFTGIILTGSLFFILSLPSVKLLSFSNAFYYLIGATLRTFGFDILKIFYSRSLIVVLPLVLIATDSSNFNSTSITGILLVYLCLSTLLYVYHRTKPHHFFLYIGRHTLIILLFSPIFTVLSKSFLPFFSFDQSYILFMIFAVIFVFIGSFAIAYLLDKTRISKIIYGKNFLNI